MSLDKTIKGLKASFSKELSKSKNSSDLEKFRIKYLGRNGQLASLFEEFNNVNGGMDVVGSWSVGSSSTRWRIGTSDTLTEGINRQPRTLMKVNIESVLER